MRRLFFPLNSILYFNTFHKLSRSGGPAADFFSGGLAKRRGADYNGGSGKSAAGLEGGPRTGGDRF